MGGSLRGCHACGFYQAPSLRRCSGCGAQGRGTAGGNTAAPPGPVPEHGQARQSPRARKGRDLAHHYWALFQELEKPRGKGDVQEAVRRGNALLAFAGGWRQAVVWAKEAWVATFGDHLEGVFDPEWGEILDPTHLEYIRASAAEGVRARNYVAPGPRVPWAPGPLRPQPADTGVP